MQILGEWKIFAGMCKNICLCCSPVSRQECREVPRQQCESVARRVPEQRCFAIPRQQCSQVQCRVELEENLREDY